MVQLVQDAGMCRVHVDVFVFCPNSEEAAKEVGGQWPFYMGKQGGGKRVTCKVAGQC